MYTRYIYFFKSRKRKLKKKNVQLGVLRSMRDSLLDSPAVFFSVESKATGSESSIAEDKPKKEKKSTCIFSLQNVKSK